jgi:hypothetical protein
MELAVQERSTWIREGSRLFIKGASLVIPLIVVGLSTSFTKDERMNFNAELQWSF